MSYLFAPNCLTLCPRAAIPLVWPGLNMQTVTWFEVETCYLRLDFDHSRSVDTIVTQDHSL